MTILYMQSGAIQIKKIREQYICFYKEYWMSHVPFNAIYSSDYIMSFRLKRDTVYWQVVGRIAGVFRFTMSQCISMV